MSSRSDCYWMRGNPNSPVEVAMIQRLISPERRRFTPATNLRFIAKFINMLGIFQRNIGFSSVLDVDRDGWMHDSTQDPKGVWYFSGIKTNITNWKRNIHLKPLEEHQVKLDRLDNQSFVEQNPVDSNQKHQARLQTLFEDLNFEWKNQHSDVAEKNLCLTVMFHWYQISSS